MTANTCSDDSRDFVCKEYLLERPYRMVSGMAVQAAHRYNRSGQWFWAADTEEPAAYIYFDTRDARSQGFGGATLTFKLVDGETINIKGPWHSNADALYEATGVDLRDKYLTWGLVARLRESVPLPRGVSGNSAYYKFTDVYHLDDKPALGPFYRIEDLARRRAKQLGHAVYYYSESRGGSSCGLVYPDEHCNGLCEVTRNRTCVTCSSQAIAPR